MGRLLRVTVSEDWPFEREPLRRWTTDGIDCAITATANPSTASLNGYVRLPFDHLWRTMPYDDIPVDVHGGLTFGNRPAMEGSLFPSLAVAETDDDTCGWIGFDTGHAFDVWTRAALKEAGVKIARETEEYWAILKQHGLDPFEPPTGYAVYWSMDMLVREVENLAHQVALTYRDLQVLPVPDPDQEHTEG